MSKMSTCPRFFKIDIDILDILDILDMSKMSKIHVYCPRFLKIDIDILEILDTTNPPIWFYKFNLLFVSLHLFLFIGVDYLFSCPDLSKSRVY